jgi:hypothetical protein
VSGTAIDIGSFRVGTALDGVDVDWRWMRPPSEGVGANTEDTGCERAGCGKIRALSAGPPIKPSLFLDKTAKKTKTFIFFC